MSKFPFFKQLDQMDCGPTCLKMIAKFHGKTYPIEYLREKSYITREGVSFLGLSEAAEAINLRTLSVVLNYDDFAEKAPLPCVVNWRQRHFIVVYKFEKGKVYCADPAFGLITYTKQQFIEGWLYNKKTDDESVVLLFETTPEFDDENDQLENKKKRNWIFLLHYLKPHKRFLWQLFYGLIASTVIQLLFPFATQAIVDYGINTRDIGFIYIILLGQLMLFISQTLIGVIRSWILLHIGARINIAILSDFLAKLMKLPISFFDSKMTSDILQRIDDNRRIESFLSSTTLNIIFSGLTFIVFGAVLSVYSLKIFLVFLVFAIIYVLWVLIFVKKRAELDYKRYDAAAENRSSILQLINGLVEIKLNNSEKRRRWEWEGVQIRLFKISVKGLSLSQLQVTGANFINELKNIIILVIAANSVVNGAITLGIMLSIQYIMGQLNAPLQDFISFLQSAQDAKISLQRLSEIHDKTNEDELSTLSERHHGRDSIILKNVGLQYGGPNSRWILEDINLCIPQGKVTAIVGTSGSGKTSLLKLLLKFFKPTRGEIFVGNVNLENIQTNMWRKDCGVVMQDGFIFADTIARNITESSSEEYIDKEKLKKSVHIANLDQMIENLPLGYNTNLSWGGVSLSGGEQQRVLISRAVYKDPSYLLFDEATSALDTNNEKIIMERLSDFFEQKTVVVVAHRLSTVKSADQIIVLDKGKIVETGTHEELVKKQNHYYTLVKNQLELGN
ncbi:peptidase domain-containing ABC transporter [Pedobacter sp. WC2501]|uniref:peptidase domain-containing ABC transporter n=1 Tax=Pedobacter sp. WC2501 TaxID=3461400 RepID=UPI0040464A39